MKQWRKRIAAAIAAAAVLLMVNGGTGMEFQAAAYQDTKEYQSLSAAFQEYFSVGVAVQAIDHWNDPTAEIGNPAKEELIVSSFNSMTFGNEFKPAYNFDPKSPTLFSVDPAAEELLDFAKENHIPVRGHTLVWHSQVNPAIFARDFQPTCRGRLTRDEKAELDEECLVDRETLIERLRTYIYGLLEYTYKNGYADVIYAWDVVNEASDEEQPDGFRRSYWYRIIGPEFLYYSFLFAREASVKYSGEYASLYGLDPEKDDLSSIRPLLFYNDYNEWFERRSDAIIRFLTEDVYNPGQSMVESAILTGDTDGTIYGDGLLDGIGMQGHLDDTQNIGQYMKALEKYDEAVGLVHITELDVGKTQKGEKGEAHQAQFYYDFFSRLMEEKEKGVNLACVTFWGLTDDASWRKGADPLLFYEDLGRKPAFEAVLAAARKDAFTLQGAPAQGDSVYSERIDFEPYKENGTTVTVPPNSVGFYSRGSGHQSVLVLVNKENHTEGAPIGFCLRVQREEKDATVKKEMNAFLGAQVEITMHVKTEDSAIILGLEGGEQTELLRTASDGDWTELHTECHIPADWPSAALYLETDGTADIYIDDIQIKAAQMPEEAQMKQENTSWKVDLRKKELPDTGAIRFAAGLGIGWNLGNTLDAFTGSGFLLSVDQEPAFDDTFTETAWQPVKTTPELIHAVKEAGFTSLRLPVSWHNHVDRDYNISPAWLDRVQEIVDYGMQEGLYVILNIHHDNDENVHCLYPDSAHLEQSEKFVRRIWQQAAERFAAYGDHLIFEGMNEPRLVGHASEWSVNMADQEIRDALECINRLNQVFVDSVRSAGGENRTRYLSCPGYAASPDGALCDAFSLPEDLPENDHRLMVTVHAYTPYDFALNEAGTDVFDMSQVSSTRDIDAILGRLYDRFIKEGTPVLLDEMGSRDKNGNLSSRTEHAAYFTARALAYGIPVLWWDNGAFEGQGELFGIIDRKTCERRYPEIITAMMDQK